MTKLTSSQVNFFQSVVCWKADAKTIKAWKNDVIVVPILSETVWEQSKLAAPFISVQTPENVKKIKCARVYILEGTKEVLDALNVVFS